MEVQFIHELDPCEITESNFDHPNLAIISIMYKMMQQPRKPDDRGDYLPQEGEEIDFMKTLFDRYHDFYYYKGTKKSPPVYDFAHWFVLNKVLHMTERKLNYLRQAWEDEVAFTNVRIS